MFVRAIARGPADGSCALLRDSWTAGGEQARLLARPPSTLGCGSPMTRSGSYAMAWQEVALFPFAGGPLRCVSTVQLRVREVERDDLCRAHASCPLLQVRRSHDETQQ